MSNHIILVRHAQSEGNRDGVGLGRADSPLTDLGHRQVAALAAALSDEPIDRVLTSPLQRALATAKAVAAPHGIAVELHEPLIEMDVGELDGVAWADARARYGEFLRAWAADGSEQLRMPGGESMADVQQRAWPLLAELLDRASGSDNGASTIVVTHNFVIRSLICRALNLDLDRWRQFEVDLTSRSVLELQRGRVVMRVLNDTCHLTAELLPS